MSGGTDFVNPHPAPFQVGKLEELWVYLMVAVVQGMPVISMVLNPNFVVAPFVIYD